ncbi:hypothetical protein GP486_000770 [Trichoglossum hirsutum]|uniref:Uncharacterized protein n=1 Tax=Trichoglossum hirsutum TaxID=265104 RepID=A0A9P8RTP1_9PEZI|nr:hypothetical protein GP486_000770 [Trichoglossum hirsutum]
MPKNALSRSSIKKSLSNVNKEDVNSLLDFIEKLERAVSADNSTPRVITAGDIEEREVFNLFELSNTYSDLGLLRQYEIPEMKAKLPKSVKPLPSTAKDLLRNIAQTWPPCNVSNVRVFISMLIHFTIDQINNETMASGPFDDSPDVDSFASQSSHQLNRPRTPEQQEPSTVLKVPVTLKAYTEVMVSFETVDSNNENVTIRGFIDYGVSYARKSPEALDTFFAIVEANAIGKLNDKAWTQLLCYMAIIQKRRKAEGKTNMAIFGCLTDGRSYQFTKISNKGKVSRSKIFSVVTQMDEIFGFFSQCLRAIIRSSPSTSPSRPSDIRAEVALFEERVQPNCIFDFEEVDAPSDELMDFEI